jgi:transposase InsO family protein
MRELSVAEQRYRAVLEVIAEGRTVGEVAAQWGVTRQTVHAWLARYEAAGLEGLADRSHRPVSCPHQMSGVVEALVLELRRAHPYWGARRVLVELARKKVDPLPSESGVYRALVRGGAIDPARRHRRRQVWKCWERGAPMELWQMDVVGGFALADGSTAKALTGVDDHSRFCVSARLMPRERTQAVCDGLVDAMRTHGVPQQILTDNGKVFTGRFFHPPVEVLFDRICRENGVDHLLTAPRSPTTTGKIERFHRTLRAEFDTAQVFTSIKVAQQALDEWVGYYNTQRPISPSMTPSRPSGSPAMTTPATAGRDPTGRRGERRSRGHEPRSPASSGSPARSPATGWSASVGSKSASVSTGPGTAPTCWSATSCCSSGSRANSSRPSPAPTTGPSARSTPPANVRRL